MNWMRYWAYLFIIDTAERDDHGDVAAQIENMGNIYEPAFLTLENSSAVNANTGLPRTR